MIMKLSNGVEISEETVVASLKASGINVEPEPKHIFMAGDIAHYSSGLQPYSWRFIALINGELVSVNKFGTKCGVGQTHFEKEKYKFVGKNSDLLRKGR